MEISWLVWLEGQTALTSAFMVFAMLRMYQDFRGRGMRISETGPLLTALFAAHGAVGAVLFGTLTLLAHFIEPRLAMNGQIMLMLGVLTLCTMAMLAIKTALTWLGEYRGKSSLWMLLKWLSAIWLGAAVAF